MYVPGYCGLGIPTRRIAPQPTNKSPEGVYARQVFQQLRNETSMNGENESWERSSELVVTTRSGFKLRLEPMGFDRDGHQLWRQVGQGVAP